ncbi:hypothetical protein BT63DRAFT_433226 [Microthyrium microscopicum]|uniref:D-xylulose reductase n=1 Tax=Microthyrium microscopicum TaxID=703497 RepID=A0A6A6U838_9PEZI|nr:hypothetical protein BT63DRAFT_433226 [Microthyrium microscopicum]
MNQSAVDKKSISTISHVLDLPQLYQKPSLTLLLQALIALQQKPKSWTADGLSAKNNAVCDPKELAYYLTSIIASPLKWIINDEQKEMIWEEAGARLAERSGRTGMSAIDRSFEIYTGKETVSISLHEPALTADNLGLKTWCASHVLSRRLHKQTLPKSRWPEKLNILELGAGTGLVGMSCAIVFNANVYLTDLPEIEPNLRRNIHSNSELIWAHGGSAVSAVLDWSNPEILCIRDESTLSCARSTPASFPLIIAADCIYSAEQPEMIVQTIKHWLSPERDSRVIFELPLRSGYSKELDDVKKCMVHQGFVMLEEAEDVGFDDWGNDDDDDRPVYWIGCKTGTRRYYNLSFVLKEPGSVIYEDRPVPEIGNPRDIIVEVKWTGICGSDVHYWVDGGIGSFKLKAPMVLGHESAGVVHSVGDKVTTLKAGDRICVEPGIPCRYCTRCREGRYNLCPDMRFAATPPYDGTLAKYFRVPEDFCYKLPEHASLEEGALMEPTSVAVHVCKLIGVEPGKKVVIFGAGPVGLLSCAVAKALGATTIVSVDINEDRVKFAQEYAASHVFRPSKDDDAETNAKNLVEQCGLGLGADAVIDATGAPPCIQMGIHVLRAGGVYCQAGMGAPEVNFPIMTMCSKELTVKGCFRYGPGDYAMAVNLLSSGAIDVKKLITRKVKFEEAEEAFKDVKAGKGIKSLIAGPE